MRILEILILAILLPGFGSLFVAPQKRSHWLRYLPGLGAVFIALHLLMEGYRWQMVPAYALTTAFVVPLAWRFAQQGHLSSELRGPPAASRWRTALRITGALIGVLVFGLAALIPVAMPVFKLPEPTGQFRVGTTRFSLVDSSRPETFTADPSDQRELLIQAWYPAEPSANSGPERLWGYPREIGSRLALSLDLPRFLFDHFDLVRTHSHRDAAIAAARSSYPVLLFSHGYNQGMPPQNTVQMEELASHGYIVVSIGHSYESLVLIHPGGKTVTVSEQQMQRVRQESGPTGPLVERLMTSKDVVDRARLLQQLSEADSVLNASVAIWVADTSFVLDELAGREGTAVPRDFARRLDMTRVGVFGMSFGGTVATDVCLLDSRCRAGINLDGLQYGLTGSPGSALKVPFMFMTSESAGLMNEPVFQRARNDAWYLIVIGSTHFNYSDFSLISPVFRTLGLLGPIEGRRMEQIMNAYIRSFFDQTLMGGDSSLLKGASADYPEVIFRAHAGADALQGTHE
ncbi:MAG: alpha/beta hydrolase family protein [Steroidobacteraceae bacterium]